MNTKHTNPADRVAAVLSGPEMGELMGEFVAMNPHWDGSQPADVLDVLALHDSHLDIVEPAYDALATSISEEWRGHIGCCTRAAAMIYKCTTHDRAIPFVLDLLERLAKARAVEDLYPNGRPL